VGFPIDDIEWVSRIKLLGVIIQESFGVEMHVNYILSVCSQRIFLMKRLRDQGLPTKYFNTVCQVIVISRLFYAIPSWSCYLTVDCGTLWQN